MRPRPRADDPSARGAGKLDGKVALITGGDSGIGRAVALAFAREGADVAIVYRNEHADARETIRLVSGHGRRRAIRIAGDVGREAFCRHAVRLTARALGRLDISSTMPGSSIRNCGYRTSRPHSSSERSARTSFRSFS
jgi:NADP-dependent 3-hydroxy acid dehydrogenase YdfG